MACHSERSEESASAFTGHPRRDLLLHLEIQIAAAASGRPQTKLLVVGVRRSFRRIGERGNDSGRDHHSDESKANEKIVHFGCSFCGRRLDVPGLNHKMMMTQVTRLLNSTLRVT
jgi:hypothetical protein